MGSDSQPNDSCRPEVRENIYRRIQASHPYPLGAIVVLTDRCNLTCSHCYNAGMKADSELTLDEVLDLFDQLRDMGTLVLVLTGGEPCVRSDFKEILSGALERRFMVSLKSNGTLISLSDVEEFWEMGLSSLTFSLYSSIPDDHDKFVGMAGAFDRTLAVALRFKELGGKCRIATVAMDWNAQSISDLIDLCEKHDFDYGVDLKVSPGVDGNMDVCFFRADDDALSRVLSDSRLNPPDDETEVDPFNDLQAVCGVGRNVVCIRPDGEVWPCVALPWNMGNVRKQTIREILDTSKELERAKSIVWGGSEKCRNCADFAVCARCPGDEFLEMGDVNAPTPLECRLARIRNKDK